MTTPFPFVSGAVLTAAQMNDITNLPINNQTASYTLLASDAGKRVIMNVGSANTVTVDDDIFSAGDTIFIANIGTATTTITEGSGVDIESSGSLALAQYGGGTLIALSASTFTFFPSGGAVNPSTVEYLVIGGGGGGGGATPSSTGGGGGAGGYRNSVSGETTGGGGASETPITITTGVVYTITVGAGGAANSGASGSVGVASSIAGTGISTITGDGGGFGGCAAAGGAGGSGGGGGGDNLSRAGGARTASPVQGFAGSAGGSSGATAGAGGGAGAVGGVAGVPSTGGAGLSSSITGSAVTRALGGNGADGSTPTPGDANTGTGGDGRSATVGAGGAGGKGVVIIRHPASFKTAAHNGTLTEAGGFKIYTFNDSGTIGWS